MKLLVLAIAHFVLILWVISLAVPSITCFQHTCYGPDLDIFMPAFFLSLPGSLAALVSLPHAIEQIKKKHSWSWFFWLIAGVGALNLLAVGLFIATQIFLKVFGY